MTRFTYLVRFAYLTRFSTLVLSSSLTLYLLPASVIGMFASVGT
jgi:hypothetical protein